MPCFGKGVSSLFVPAFSAWMLFQWRKLNKWGLEESLQNSFSDWMHTEPTKRALVAIAIRAMREKAAQRKRGSVVLFYGGRSPLTDFLL